MLSCGPIVHKLMTDMVELYVPLIFVPPYLRDGIAVNKDLKRYRAIARRAQKIEIQCDFCKD